jgi:hypothetical protein
MLGLTWREVTFDLVLRQRQAGGALATRPLLLLDKHDAGGPRPIVPTFGERRRTQLDPKEKKRKEQIDASLLTGRHKSIRANFSNSDFDRSTHHGENLLATEHRNA